MATASTTPDSSFYVVGGTVRRDAPCYVQREADSLLFESLRRGEFCYVLTARQMGKSSLMVRTASRLREAGAGVAVLDLTAIGQNLTAAQWYGGLVTQLGQQLDLEDELLEFRREQEHLGPLQCWMEAILRVILPRYVRQVVIFVDEIDTVRSLPFSTDEFFAGIREFYNRRAADPQLERLTFCLLGVASPSDLIRDTRTTPFNIGRRIELHDFSEAEAMTLAQGFARQDLDATELLKRVRYWTGGHPYLTQRLCQAVAQSDQAPAPGNLQLVDRSCEELFFASRARERDDNLLFVRERMLRSEVDVPGLLKLYERAYRGYRVVDDETNPLVSVLRLSGITRAVDGLLRVRNRIYERVFDRRWVEASMPNAERRRQRAAYRRGLLLAGSIAAVILAVIGSLAWIAFRQARVAKREQEANRQLLYGAHINLADKALKTDNMIGLQQELMRAWSPDDDLRGFEWYYLWRLCHRDLLTLRHSGGALYNVAFSPDGRIITTGGNADEGVKVWDSTSGRELAALKSDAGILGPLVFSPDGSRMATVGADSSAILWDTTTWQARLTLKGHKGDVNALAFSPDGRKLATGSDDATVRVWNTATGQELFGVTAHTNGVRSVSFSPDGATLASGGLDKAARLWNADTGALLATLERERNPGAIYALIFTPDGKTLLIAAERFQTFQRWDVVKRQSLPDVTEPGYGLSALSIAVSGDGKRMALGCWDRTVKLWDLSIMKEVLVLQGHGDAVDGVAFSPDGGRLATASRDGNVRTWDVSNLDNLGDSAALMGHKDMVNCVAISPDGKKAATGSFDGTAKLWDVETARELTTLKGHKGPILSLAFAPDGAEIATASADATVKLWDVATGGDLSTIEGSAHELGGGLTGGVVVAFSPDGKRLAVGGRDNTIKVIDRITRNEQAVLRGHKGDVLSVAFSPEGRRVATGSTDRSAVLWDARDGRQLAQLTGHRDSVYDVVFSPDGRTLATGGFDGRLKLWDAITGKERSTIEGLGGQIWSLAFSSQGNRIAVASGGVLGISLLDPATGLERMTLPAHQKSIHSVAFSRDGRTLISGSVDHTARLWRAATEAEVVNQRKNR